LPEKEDLPIGEPVEKSDSSRLHQFFEETTQAATEQNLFPDDIHRLRALVKKYFQYCELRKPEA
jgi:hypothetical protein